MYIVKNTVIIEFTLGGCDRCFTIDYFNFINKHIVTGDLTEVTESQIKVKTKQEKN